MFDSTPNSYVSNLALSIFLLLFLFFSSKSKISFSINKVVVLFKLSSSCFFKSKVYFGYSEMQCPLP